MNARRRLGFALAICAQLLAVGAKAAPADLATVEADNALVGGVFKATEGQGYAAIADKLAALEAVVNRAPKPFALTERDGDKVYVRTTSLPSCLMAMAEAARYAKGGPGAVKSTACVWNPYTQAAFLLGTYWDEQKRFEQGLTWLDRSLALDPDYGPGVVERGLALNQLRRFDEALANDRAALALTSALFDDHTKGSLLRGEGFALTELGRLDEAEAAYRQSLKVDPSHGNAPQELIYIARLRAGAPRTAMRIDSQANPAPH